VYASIDWRSISGRKHAGHRRQHTRPAPLCSPPAYARSPQAALNPFHTVNTPIRNPLFEAKVRASARKYL
jgi:hypothetical protein